jgi:hypothetical protein
MQKWCFLNCMNVIFVHFGTQNNCFFPSQKTNDYLSRTREEESYLELPGNRGGEVRAKAGVAPSGLLPLTLYLFLLTVLFSCVTYKPVTLGQIHPSNFFQSSQVHTWRYAVLKGEGRGRTYETSEI